MTRAGWWPVLLALAVVPLTSLPAGERNATRDAGNEAPAWRQASEDYVWSFPRDHWPHPDYAIEWWYLTGHLETRQEPRRSFGYQFTVFRIGLTPQPPVLDSAWAASAVWMGHASLTDKDRGAHRFSEVLHRASPLLAGFAQPGAAPIAWSRAPAGTDDTWELSWNGEGFDLSMRDARRGFALRLRTVPLRPRVFQGPNGYSRKGNDPDAASHYYSYTRLDTRGQLELDGGVHDVTGISWMDHEFSTSHLSDDQVGWDWFSLQLDDGRDVMLYRLRGRDASGDFSRGTLVAADGSTRFLMPGDWSVRASGSWSSPASGATYPSGWRLQLPGEPGPWTVEPLIPNQENVASRAGGLHYWEGAVTVRDAAGRPLGRGYVELTGYGEGNRPPV